MSSFSRSRSHSGYAARRPAKSPQELRHAWNAAVMLAGSLAAEALSPTAGDDPGIGRQVFTLRAMVNDLDAATFPVEAVSARAMATAFLVVGKTWTHPATAPEARTACAGFLRAGASCLDALMSQLRSAEAQAWQGRYGREDD